ncbi:MAG: hypothetical protein ACLGH0_01705 [Thermoanaerobaculia bacterium]
MKNHLSHDTGMHRRQFLVLSSTAVAGIAATSVSAGTPGALTMLKGPGPVLSVGFVNSDAAEGTRVVPAERIGLTDVRFRQSGARVTVHGLSRSATRRQQAAGVSLIAFFDTNGQRLPFIAWSGVSGARVNFRVPVDADGAISFGVERTQLTSILREPARRFASIFTAARSQAAAEVPQHDVLERSGSVCRLGADVKLRRGTYFIALRETTRDRVPDWGSLSVAGSSLRRGNEPVDFDYLVLSVDHA